MQLAQAISADFPQEQARSSTTVDVERFWRDGYLGVRNALPRDQVLQWRQRHFTGQRIPDARRVVVARG